ncbi:MAG: hypothetical protein H3Z50_02125 [archaeon]|nr:hypothetical protein [archaeon]MCP8306947.1 hypothetical protein [archaeon]
MRMLMLHVDYFRSTISKKGRSRIVEEPESKTMEVKEALIILSSVEKQDERDPESVSRKATEQISKLAKQLKIGTMVLHPFTHLFGELSKPEVAVEILELTKKGLIEKGFKVVRTPFGWFCTLELKAKGHPLASVARIVSFLLIWAIHSKGSELLCW